MRGYLTALCLTLALTLPAAAALEAGPGLWRYDLADGRLTRLGDGLSIDWSPALQRVLYLQQVDRHTSRLCSMASDGTGRRVVATNVKPRCWWSRASADGRFVATVGLDFGKSDQQSFPTWPVLLTIYRADGRRLRGPVTIGRWEFEQYQPVGDIMAWSTSGHSLAITPNLPDQRVPYVLDPVTGQRTKFTGLPDAQQRQTWTVAGRTFLNRPLAADLVRGRPLARLQRPVRGGGRGGGRQPSTPSAAPLVRRPGRRARRGPIRAVTAAARSATAGRPRWPDGPFVVVGLGSDGPAGRHRHAPLLVRAGAQRWPGRQRRRSLAGRCRWPGQAMRALAAPGELDLQLAEPPVWGDEGRSIFFERPRFVTSCGRYSSTHRSGIRRQPIAAALGDAQRDAVEASARRTIACWWAAAHPTRSTVRPPSTSLLGS